MFGPLNMARTVAPTATVTTGALANLLAEQNRAFDKIGQSITGIGDVAGQYGQDVRTGTLNDLIARGELEGLTEPQIMTKVAELGGDFSPEGQATLSSLIQSKRDEAKLAGAMNQLLAEQEFKASEAEKQRTHEAGIEEKKISSAEKINTQTNAVKKKIAEEQMSTDIHIKDKELDEQKRANQQKYEIEKGKLDAETKKIKETTLSKTGVGLMDKDTLRNAVNDVEEFISDETDFFLDRELDDVSKQLVRQKIFEYLQTPEGQSAYAIGGKEELYNNVEDFMAKAGLELEDKFEWANILPTGDSPFQKTLKKK